jgi:hypothetical protein
MSMNWISRLPCFIYYFLRPWSILTFVYSGDYTYLLISNIDITLSPAHDNIKSTHACMCVIVEQQWSNYIWWARAIVNYIKCCDDVVGRSE